MKYPKNQLEFECAFATEGSCQEYRWQLRFPKGFLCPSWNGVDHWNQTRSRKTCSSGSYELSVLAGTIFQKSHLPLTIWFRACWWFTNQKQGVSALGLQRALGIGSYRTAWLVLHKLRRAMITPGRNLLCGEVEVDEVYIGGKESPGEKYRSSKQLILIAAEKMAKASDEFE
ncbi:MAG: IS1595 family transposase [Proteobacteria bacterium]|nr:IS1595 family transposase [Pseudomonadota bacterium]